LSIKIKLDDMKTESESKSILRQFIETADWTESLDDIKTRVKTIIAELCQSPRDKGRMLREVDALPDLEKLQLYIFNALLKFEGQGVQGLLPR
jgi:hypothetical protein